MAGLIDAARKVLTDAGIDVHDTRAAHPEVQYVVIDSGIGLAQPHRLSITAHWATDTISVMCVGRTPQGCRALALRVREALTSQRIPAGAPPLRELESSQPLADTDDMLGDTRYSLTIRYRQPNQTNL